MSPGDRLQQQRPLQCHWALADSLLLQAIASGEPIKRGAAGTRLKWLVDLFIPLRLIYPLIFMVGAFELTTLLFRQWRKSNIVSEATPRTTDLRNLSFLFVGFGAGPEESIFAAYCAEKALPVSRINQTRVESMGQWHKVGVIQALTSLLRSITLARNAVVCLPQAYSPWKNDFLTFVAMRIGYFSYTTAWFCQVKAGASGIKEVCFLSADTPAFAAVNAGLATRYLQHGLIRHSLVLPNFDSVDALTHDEALHFRQRLPEAVVRLTQPVMPPISPRRPLCILVASVYSNHGELRRVVPFLEFANQQGVVIHVRPHPCEDPSFWKKGNLPFHVSLEDEDASFDAALERLRPTLVVSWFSTALLGALYRGVVPVSVSARDDPNIRDMVYPLFRHCLHWPSDQKVLGEIIAEEAAYKVTLNRLRAGME